MCIVWNSLEASCGYDDQAESGVRGEGCCSFTSNGTQGFRNSDFKIV